jgi:hypothetical protein
MLQVLQAKKQAKEVASPTLLEMIGMRLQPQVPRG